MEAVARSFGIILRGFSATRYLISLVTGIIILIYGVLWVTGLVPTDTLLANNLRMSIGLLLVLLYLIIAGIIISLWYWFVERPADIGNMLFVKPIYRQTDVSGLHGFNVILIVLIIFSLILSQNIRQIDRPVTVFLALIVLIPLLLDLSPAQRPRRLIAPKHGTTLDEFRQALDQTDQIDLVKYNAVTPDSEQILYMTPLPSGLFIEIPPGTE